MSETDPGFNMQLAAEQYMPYSVFDSYVCEPSPTATRLSYMGSQYPTTSVKVWVLLHAPIAPYNTFILASHRNQPQQPTPPEPRPSNTIIAFAGYRYISIHHKQTASNLTRASCSEDHTQSIETADHHSAR